MVYSNKIICALLVAGAALCGCSQQDDIEMSNKEVAAEDCANVVFKLQTNAATAIGTRSSAEDSYIHVQGTADEYKVNNARVYLFDAPTKLFVKSILLTNISYNSTHILILV